MVLQMIHPEIPLAQSIIQIAKAKGLNTIIISPGSRNAPLTIGFSSDPFFNCYSIADERCAAFFGLGIAQQTLTPAILVCTSGSALLNYYPAVAEAFYSQIPLIVISADRPTDKIDIGDGQTIRQRNVYDNHSLYNANLTEEASASNDLLIQNAISVAINKKGPVHINAPFEEPLYNTLAENTYTPALVDIEKPVLPAVDFTSFKELWNNTPKKLVLIGVENPGFMDEEIINLLGNDPSVVVMTEVTSNLHHPNFVSTIDTLITSFSEDDFKKLQPDLLITTGGMVVSKRIKAFLRKYKPKAHWHVDELRAYDTFQALNAHIKADPNLFFKAMYASSEEINSPYQSWVLTLMESRKKGHQKYLENIVFSDFKAFDIIWKHLPGHLQLQISNSASIRYAQLFDTKPSIRVFCNRGTSGIDGSTSTAIGAAVVSKEPTVLITGDIGFLYDSNALWNNYTPKDFKIILINNGGGGIFRILPGHQEQVVFNTYFETEHQLDASHLAKMFGYEYYTATDEQTLEKSLSRLFSEENERPAILEIFTPTKINQDILKEYFKVF